VCSSRFVVQTSTRSRGVPICCSAACEAQSISAAPRPSPPWLLLTITRLTYSATRRRFRRGQTYRPVGSRGSSVVTVMVPAGTAASHTIQVLPHSRSRRMRSSRVGLSGHGRAHWSVFLPRSHSAASSTNSRITPKSEGDARQSRYCGLPTDTYSRPFGASGTKGRQNLSSTHRPAHQPGRTMANDAIHTNESHRTELFQCDNRFP
jgi:hypothetical protein